MTSKSTDIPHNVMEFEDECFFDFAKVFAGDKLAALLKFQDISNVNCLLACNDPFEILSYDSDDLLDLKKKTSIKLNSNSFVVLPGIKSKMMLLKNALTKKRNELKKQTTKISSNIMMTNNTASISLIIDHSTNSTCSSEQELANNSSSSGTTSNFEENVKKHLIKLLNEWSQKMEQNNNQQNYQIKDGIDYHIIVDSINNKVLIKCQCGKCSILGQKNNSYILSNYIRHLTNENPCSMVQKKLKNSSENMAVDAASILDDSNTSADRTIDTVLNSISSSQAPSEKRKRNQTSCSSLSKKKKKI